MGGKGKDTELLTDLKWIDELSFLVGMTQHLSELNRKLQGRDPSACDMYDHVCCFERKLSLFHSQLLQGNAAHFELLSSRDTPGCTKYASLVEKLRNKFSSRFCDFK